MIMTAVFHFAQLGGMIIWCFIFYFIFLYAVWRVPLLYMVLWKTAILNAYLIKFLNFFNQLISFIRDKTSQFYIKVHMIPNVL